MLWLIVILLLLVLGVHAWLWWRLSQLAATLASLTTLRAAPDPMLPPSVPAVPNLEPGSTFLPTDQERAAIEARLVADSAQRAGSVRSKTNSRTKRG